eukprot:SAG31_NODE_273_length_18667_cov_3.603619_19_plen_62_part_00
MSHGFVVKLVYPTFQAEANKLRQQLVEQAAAHSEEVRRLHGVASATESDRSELVRPESLFC